MQTAIANVSLSGTLKEKLEAIAAAQFKGVEIFENGLLSYNGTPADVRNLVRDLGLKTITFQPFRDFEGMGEGSANAPSRARAQVRPHGRARLRSAGIGRPRGKTRYSGRLRRAGLASPYQRLSRCVGSGASRRSSGGRLVLDTVHILVRNTDLKRIRSIPRERVFLVQVAGAPRLDMDYLSWCRHFRSMPGQGDLPLLSFMEALHATGFDGLLRYKV